MIKWGGVALLLLVALPGVQALSFSEDFEGVSLGGFGADPIPDQDWYDFAQGNEVGEVRNTGNIPAGSQAFQMNATAGAGSSGNTATFTLAAPSQLSNLTFLLQGTTVTDDGVGSQQVVAIQSVNPVRTLVEFYIFCTSASDPSGCQLRVRFDNVDTTGEVLIDYAAADSLFNITVLPDWTTGTFQLYVDGVDDGTFPFLELPSSIGRIKLSQHVSAYPLGLALDDWFIDGAQELPTTEVSDIGQGLKNFASAINFTTTGSLFLLGVVFLAILALAVAIPLITLGLDNSVIPAVSFFFALVVLWLVNLEWFPEWVGIAMIIMVAALVALVVRQLLMGIKDASTNAGIVAGSLGYFIIATALLGFSGYATESIEVPTSSLETPDDVEAQTNESAPQQSFGGAVAECLITFFSDCSTSTESTIWATITDVAGTIFNFARTAFVFLFQLLTFSLPIPVLFNVILVLPPAAALATVGFAFITRSGA